MPRTKERRVDPAETNNCYRLARSSGTATKLGEDYCFIHKALRPVAKARRQIAGRGAAVQIRGLIHACLNSQMCSKLSNF